MDRGSDILHQFGQLLSYLATFVSCTFVMQIYDKLVLISSQFNEYYVRQTTIIVPIPLKAHEIAFGMGKKIVV